MLPDIYNEHEHALAREAAADNAGWTETCRTAFISGWNAAMVYASKQAAEGVEHLDDDECCHFQD